MNPITLVTTFLLLFTTTHLIRVDSAEPHALYACNSPYLSSSSPTTRFPFCNPSLPITQRVQDLVSRLTLDEKIAQLTDTAPPIPRLGIPAYEWWSESLHGVSKHGRGYKFNGTFTPNGTLINGTATIRSATMFPQIILTAASFDPHLWYRVAQAIATEARSMFNAGQGKGMTFWAPNINIYRDPRWGRGQETPGEDPFMAAKYGVAYVRGLQGYTFEGRKMFDFLQASACCKHYTAHDLDNWHGVTRYVFDAKVSKQDLADTFQPPFRSCVEEGQASSIMCAYNRINGIPSCANHGLLTQTARHQWRFNGYITSDCMAVPIIHEDQGYAKTPEEAVADVLKAGMDVECGTYTQKYAKVALQKKKITEQEIDRAVRNLFSVRMRLGLFDPNPSNKAFGNMSSSRVCSKEHQDLALEAARSGMVLLKNTANLLPLCKTKTASLGVMGPNANSPDVLLGNYEGVPCKATTALQGLQSYIQNIKYHPGCSTVECSSPSIHEMVRIAKEVDQVVLVMGLDQTQEREKKDRVNLELPGGQQAVITSVAGAAKNPVILVLLCGGPVDISFAKDHKNIGGILWAGYPGEAGGTAIAEVLFGDHNPGGRLPVTWYPQEYTRIPMTDMRMRPEKSTGYPGRTYRFYQGKKVYEFGYGLSYSSYSYKILSVSRDRLYLDQSSRAQAAKILNSTRNYMLVSELGKRFCDKMKFLTVVEIKNLGKMAGRHPVLLFLKPSKQKEGSPIKQLIGFQSVKLNEGERVEARFIVSPCEHLSKANGDGLVVIEAGNQSHSSTQIVRWPSCTSLTNSMALASRDSFQFLAEEPNLQSQQLVLV
ncbi:Probable beta-D-xylosidase 7, variant 2 [Ancistrocladus abbreviatus]